MIILVGKVASTSSIKELCWLMPFKLLMVAGGEVPCQREIFVERNSCLYCQVQEPLKYERERLSGIFTLKPIFQQFISRIFE